jgi:hypothetical protein
MIEKKKTRNVFCNLELFGMLLHAVAMTTVDLEPYKRMIKIRSDGHTTIFWARPALTS